MPNAEDGGTGLGIWRRCLALGIGVVGESFVEYLLCSPHLTWVDTTCPMAVSCSQFLMPLGVVWLPSTLGSCCRKYVQKTSSLGITWSLVDTQDL